MSKIKYSSQWQVEKLEHEYFKEMKMNLTDMYHQTVNFITV